MAKIETQKYREYLDKEMTIMGILSAVSIAAPAGILNALVGDGSPIKTALWAAGRFDIVAGSILCVLAASFFYKQRSLLAWFYGQICLVETSDVNNSNDFVLGRWCTNADAWDTWVPYSWGFTALVAGFLEYLMALLFFLHPTQLPSWMFTRLAKIVGLSIIPLVGLGFGRLQKYVMERYRLEEDYWQAFRSDIRSLFRPTLPHHRVYTRLRPSPISSVGVFAIIEIKEGTYIFEPDDDELVSVNVDDVKNLPPIIRKLYEDFCVLRGNKYECPSSFNALTPSWFLNHSKSPNVAADLSLKFYAIRNIQPDEELTVDYETYGDTDPTMFNANP